MFKAALMQKQQNPTKSHCSSKFRNFFGSSLYVNEHLLIFYAEATDGVGLE